MNEPHLIDLVRDMAQTLLRLDQRLAAIADRLDQMEEPTTTNEIPIIALIRSGEGRTVRRLGAETYTYTQGVASS